MITVDVVIDKATTKDLLNCNQNKEAPVSYTHLTLPTNREV